MTNREQKLLLCGVGAGTIFGLALGLMIALFLAIRPASAGTMIAFVTGLLVAFFLALVAIKPDLFAARSR